MRGNHDATAQFHTCFDLSKATTAVGTYSRWLKRGELQSLHFAWGQKKMKILHNNFACCSPKTPLKKVTYRETCRTTSFARCVHSNRRSLRCAFQQLTLRNRRITTEEKRGMFGFISHSIGREIFNIDVQSTHILNRLISQCRRTSSCGLGYPL